MRKIETVFKENMHKIEDNILRLYGFTATNKSSL